MAFLGIGLAIIAGIGSLICFIMVLIHYFNQGETGFGITCIVLTFICGIGPLIAFVKGWMDGLGNIMLIWTGCVAAGFIANILVFASGGFAFNQ